MPEQKTKRYNFEIQLNYSKDADIERSNFARDMDWQIVMDLFKNHPLIKDVLFVPELKFSDEKSLGESNGIITMDGSKAGAGKDYWNGYLQVSVSCWDVEQRDKLLILIDEQTLNKISADEAWARYCVEDLELKLKCPACGKYSTFNSVVCEHCSWKLTEKYKKEIKRWIPNKDMQPVEETIMNENETSMEWILIKSNESESTHTGTYGNPKLKLAGD